MPDHTPRFNLTVLDSIKDTLAYRNHKFTRADRVLLDRLLVQAAERHRHIGTGDPSAPPSTPQGPLLATARTGGVIPANTTIHYCTVLVDERGQDQPPSQTATVTTAAPISAPSAFFMGANPGAGTLLPGDYVFAVSAYTDDTHNETTVSRTTTGRLDAIGGWSIFLPPVPSGATGLNVYRKGPTDRDLRFVYATTLTDVTFEDDGSNGDELRGVPTTNSTCSTNTVTVTPFQALNPGETLKIYRTYTATNWDQSFLIWTAVTPTLDTGHATHDGSPTPFAAALGDPPKIDFATDVEGHLPPGAVTTHTTATFTFIGPVAVGTGPWQWVNEFEDAQVIGLQAHLGRNAAPVAQPVIVALDRRAHHTNIWHRYTDVTSLSDIQAQIPEDTDAGSMVAVPADASPGTRLAPGDALRPVILQAGGGATPTDTDLAITVTLAVRQGPIDQTHLWEP